MEKVSIECLNSWECKKFVVLLMKLGLISKLKSV